MIGGWDTRAPGRTRSCPAARTSSLDGRARCAPERGDAQAAADARRRRDLSRGVPQEGGGGHGRGGPGEGRCAGPRGAWGARARARANRVNLANHTETEDALASLDTPGQSLTGELGADLAAARGPDAWLHNTVNAFSSRKWVLALAFILLVAALSAVSGVEISQNAWSLVDHNAGKRPTVHTPTEEEHATDVALGKLDSFDVSDDDGGDTVAADAAAGESETEQDDEPAVGAEDDAAADASGAEEGAEEGDTRR